MRQQVENGTYPDIEIAFDGSTVTAVTAKFADGRRVDVPVEALDETFGRTAAKVFDWCLLDQQARDCFVFGRPLVERECIPSMRLLSVDYDGVWQVWMDEVCRGGRRTIRVNGSAIRNAVDELVAAVRCALHELLNH